MTHFSANKTRSEATPPEWLKVGSQIGDFVNARSGHEDILAYLGEGAGQGSAACFCPTIAEIELNTEICFGENSDPLWIGDFNDRATLFEWPKAAGALIHEASHARWTVWDLEKQNAYSLKAGNTRVMGVLERMEESRIEANAVLRWPEDTPFLRSSAMEIVMGEINLDGIMEHSPMALSQLMLLTVAREDAGVLAEEDTAELKELFKEFFTPDGYERFRELWLKVQMIRDHESAFEIMVPLAEAWVDLLPEEPELSDKTKQALSKIQEMLDEANESAEIGANEDADDQQETERWSEQVKESQSQAEETREHQKVSEQVFGKSTEDIPDTSTNSRIIKKRPPTDRERSAAVTVGRALDKARYRDRISIEVKTLTPPGRLSTRDAIQGVAQRRRGEMVTAEPWERTLRRHVEDPNLTVGVMVDISGSMDSAMIPMAVTAYVLAEAGSRIQAKMAQVYYGNSAFPTLKPGQRMTEVIIRSAADGTERFNKAFKALDGQLQLLNGSGARLLVICSDMCYVPHEVEACKQWVGRCVKAGVGVLCLPFDYGYHVKMMDFPRQVQVIQGSLDPAEAATLIGQAAVKALEQAGNTR